VLANPREPRRAHQYRPILVLGDARLLVENATALDHGSATIFLDPGERLESFYTSGVEAILKSKMVWFFVNYRVDM